MKKQYIHPATVCELTNPSLALMQVGGSNSEDLYTEPEESRERSDDSFESAQHHDHPFWGSLW